jgi:hypothetical protein
MSFIRDDGQPIYEGPFLATTDNAGTKITVEQLLPHMSRACQLRYCFPVATPVASVYGFPNFNTAGNWQTAAQAVTQAIRQYTIEIEWRAAAQEAHPPIAFLQQLNVHVDGGIQRWASMSSDQMVSLKHYKD